MTCGLADGVGVPVGASGCVALNSGAVVSVDVTAFADFFLLFFSFFLPATSCLVFAASALGAGASESHISNNNPTSPADQMPRMRLS